MLVWPRGAAAAALVALVATGLLALPACGATTAPVLVAYQRTGGLIAFDDRLTVRTDRHAVLRRRDRPALRFRVSRRTLERIQDGLRRARWATIRRSYLPRYPVADGLDYRITHARKTVHTTDGAIPRRLEALLRVLNAIVDRR